MYFKPIVLDARVGHKGRITNPVIIAPSEL